MAPRKEVKARPVRIFSRPEPIFVVFELRHTQKNRSPTKQGRGMIAARNRNFLSQEDTFVSD